MKSEKVWFKTADSAGDGTLWALSSRSQDSHSWDSGTKSRQPGFFPSIIAIVMVITSIAAFFQTLKEEDQPKYNKAELMVIAGGAAANCRKLHCWYDPDDFSVCTVLADCD